ncbi:MAG: orotate phosphoribosyltransferase [Gammaproteobacteria bacterium HGW-Gammaproteobacteria-8]|nr:MAG: orotate phosphoribosyltransferase [Gammaproteobacteria bacterium HGW-Gammaproteobacteria-8]
MSKHTERFIDLARSAGALKFGRFELKSGRISPYFFNAGEFSYGRLIAEVADCYADAIVAAGVKFDRIFGPAYKGIPLAATVAASLWQRHGLNLPVAYNRKEAKDHGEGGQLVGAPLTGRVLVVDDVVSAGTAFAEARAIIEAAGAEVSALAVGLDRQERGQAADSAAAEIAAGGVQVVAVATLDALIEAIRREPSNSELLSAMLDYRLQYGA